MATRTAQPIDPTTLLHTGQVSVNCAGFNDPSGNPWIVMDDQASAKNGLYIRNNASGVAVVVGVGGAGADTNPALSIYAGNASTASTGTGALIMGSSAGTITLGGTVTASQALTMSSNLTVTGTISASTVNSCTVINASTINSCTNFTANNTGSSSQFTAFYFGGSSSTYQRMAIYTGSSFPSIVAPQPGSMFFFQSGTSSTSILVAGPNGGTGSSSNWWQFLAAGQSSFQ